MIGKFQDTLMRAAWPSLVVTVRLALPWLP